MNIQIIGNGAFGGFLKKILAPECNIVEDADTVILAVPISSYEEVCKKNKGKTLINVCSVQSEANKIASSFSNNVLGIHPLFGARSGGKRSRNSIVTLRKGEVSKQMSLFCEISNIHFLDEEIHDKIMAETHGVSVFFAQKAKKLIKETEGIPDYMVPNSFNLLRDFVDTLQDMPKGTLESILSNPFIKNEDKELENLKKERDEARKEAECYRDMSECGELRHLRSILPWEE